MKSLLRVSILAAAVLLLVEGLRKPADAAGLQQSYSNICSDNQGGLGNPIGGSGIYAQPCTTCTGPMQAWEIGTCGTGGLQALPCECDATNPINDQRE
jgi:hypothetical protein